MLRPIDARRAMTIRAALCGECLGAGLHAGRIVDGGWGPILRMADWISAQRTIAGSSTVPATL
jgi:hypothetical protein